MRARARAGTGRPRGAVQVRSVLRLDGAAADEFKHAVPPVQARRIAITMRRVDPAADRRLAEAERQASSEQQRILRRRQQKASKRLGKQRVRGGSDPQQDLAEEAGDSDVGVSLADS
jgi:hypothetical protein